jgi:Rieske Fe-S protein
MSKHNENASSQAVTDGKLAAGDGTLSRRAVLIVAGQAAAAGALYACEGKDTGNDDLAMNRDMRGANKDMRGGPDLSGPRDLAPGPDMRRVCMPVAATDAELLAVDQAKTYRNQDWPFESFIVARDAKGFYALRNVCSHNSCQVNFNAADKTFDCPCHGSRYNFDGTVLMGPAPLALRSFPLTKLGDGTLQVDPCGPGSTDLSDRVT